MRKSNQAFSVQADSAIAAAFEWLKGQREERIPAFVPFKRESYMRPLRQANPIPYCSIPERDKPILRVMAESCGVIEYGGKAIRERSPYQTGGDVVGRTAWIGLPEWADGFGMSADEIRNTVAKALAGERLGKRQQELIDAMLASIYATRANVEEGERAQWSLDGEAVTEGAECPF